MDYYSLLDLEDQLTVTSGDIMTQVNDLSTLPGTSQGQLLIGDGPSKFDWVSTAQGTFDAREGVFSEKIRLEAQASDPTISGGNIWLRSDNDFRYYADDRPLVGGMVNMIQCRQTSGVSRDNLNASTVTWTVVAWNAEDVKDSLYSHSNSTNPSRITVAKTGWYKITYCVSTEDRSTSRKNIWTSILVNGSSVVPGQCYAYSRNTTDEWASNTCSSIHRLTAGDYVEIGGRREGSSGQARTVQNGSTFILIEFLRFSN